MHHSLPVTVVRDPVMVGEVIEAGPWDHHGRYFPRRRDEDERGRERVLLRKPRFLDREGYVQACPWPAKDRWGLSRNRL